jgi:HK97 family phage portal protein
MGRRIADFWQRVDALDRRVARALLGRPPEEERTWQNWWNQAGAPGFISSAVYGMIGRDDALRNAASWACIDILSDALGRTPLDAFRGSGTLRNPIDPAPPLLLHPSGIVSADVWRYQLGFSLATDGNAFGRITSMTPMGWPTTIELLDPTDVKDRKVVAGTAQVTIDNVVNKLYPAGDIWHVPGRVVPAGTPFGLSPVKQADEVIGTSLAAQQFASDFFSDGAHPSSIIYSAKDLNSDQAAAIKHAWRRATTGNREPAVLGGDLKHEKIQVDPKDSQFIDTMRFAIEQVCRFWRVPPAMVYGAVSGESITYANVSDADLAFLKHSLDGLYVRVETALTDVMPRPQYAKYNRNAILRADISARFTVYEMGIRNGIYNRNEIRALEDMPPIPVNGDEYVWPPVGKGAGMDVRPPSTGGVVEEKPGGGQIQPTLPGMPVPAAKGNGKAPAPAK